MTDYISEIACIDKSERFNAITNVLKAHGIAYQIQPLPYSGALGNVIVPFHSDKAGKKIAVTAHYDNFPGTPGANDNAAACSILLNLILNLKEKGTEKPIEFVFFDMEEAGFRGSRDYLAQNADSLLVVFNLDMCGMGSNTVVSYHNGAKGLLRKGWEGSVTVLEMLPPGDAYTFISAGVPTVYVINSTDRDLSWFSEFARTGYLPHGNPDFGMTMHQSNDLPCTCNPEQVEEICEFVKYHII